MKLYLDKLPDNVKQVKNALTWVSETGEFYGQETRTLPSNEMLIKKFYIDIMVNIFNIKFIIAHLDIFMFL